VKELLGRSPDWQAGLRIASAASARHRDTATLYAVRLQAVDPAFRVLHLAEDFGPYQQPAFVEKYAEALRIAGLPE
jgi:hypothetical protein